MIEFVLLFTLGFLAAALVALIVAPIIHRRIVSLTERRIRASVPLSAAEIRAEKDMARAAFAAENARLSVDLKHNRDQLTESIARSTRLSNDLVSIRGEKLSAEKLLEERDASIRDLNAEVHDRDAKITTLTGNFSDAARLAEARKQEIAKRDDHINRLSTEIEELRIDLVTLDTEIENFKSQIRELRDERNALREALKNTENANRDMENRLKSNDERLAQNEEKLAKTITVLTDRENALDRRVAEVERFRQKNRELSDEIRAAKNALKEATAGARKSGNLQSGSFQPQASEPELPEVDDIIEDPQPVTTVAEVARPEHKPENAAAPQAAEKPEAAQPKPDINRILAAVQKVEQANNRPQVPADDDLSESEKINRLRARQAALVERLLKADKPNNDAALRREISIVAAMMVELTASRDGSSSPVYAILKGSEDPSQPGNSEPSLAARSRAMLSASR